MGGGIENQLNVIDIIEVEPPQIGDYRISTWVVYAMQQTTRHISRTSTSFSSGR